MKNLKFICLIAALLGLVISDPAFARGGQGAGNSVSGGGSRGFSGGGHRGFSGGARHFRGGHRSFGGSHRHFSSGHSHSGHSHNRYNFGFNLGYYSPAYYGYRPYGYRYRSYYRSPYYGYPSYYQRALPSTQIVYVQREEIKPVQPQANYWHYCRNPEGYYPYVKKCPEGWLQVAPQPAVQ
jgi:hypothetical protein